MFSLEVVIYLAAGSAVLYLYLTRKKGLSRLSPEALPELDTNALLELRGLLETSYERALYLGIIFFVLAAVTLADLGANIKAVAMMAAIVVFLLNIPPRNKVMRLITSNGMDPEEMKKRGIRL